LKEKNVSIRISKEDFDAISRKADIYTGGNVTAWITYAATVYHPPKEDLVCN